MTQSRFVCAVSFPGSVEDGMRGSLKFGSDQYFGLLGKWATGPWGERSFSGAGVAMTYRRFGMGTYSTVQSF